MRHAPADYGDYWAAAIRVTAGALVVLLVHRSVSPLLEHQEPLAVGLGWVVFALGLFVGSLLGVLGLAIAVETAVGEAEGG